MYEIYLRLRFDSPCLGSARSDVEENTDRMLRSPDGSVMFSQVWWRTIVCQGARCFGRHQERVKSVLWTSTVDGTTQMFRRYYHLRGENGESQRLYKDHEAFLAGDVIGIKALVPDDVPLEDFRDIMAVAGEYFGISPFGWKMGYGKFKVLETARTRISERQDAVKVTKAELKLASKVEIISEGLVDDPGFIPPGKNVVLTTDRLRQLKQLVNETGNKGVADGSDGNAVDQGEHSGGDAG